MVRRVPRLRLCADLRWHFVAASDWCAWHSAVLLIENAGNSVDFRVLSLTLIILHYRASAQSGCGMLWERWRCRCCHHQARGASPGSFHFGKRRSICRTSRFGRASSAFRTVHPQRGWPTRTIGSSSQAGAVMLDCGHFRPRPRPLRFTPRRRVTSTCPRRSADELLQFGRGTSLLGLPVPDTRDAAAVVSGAERSSTRPSGAKVALTVDQLREISAQLVADGSPMSVRDRAILLFGFATGMRRAELAALRLADVAVRPKGLAVTIRRSKTDQAGKGRVVGVFRAASADVCPVRALRQWMRVRGRWTGPLFVGCAPKGNLSRAGLSGRAVGECVQRCVARIGLDPAQFGGHSLRAGMVTTALESGAGELVVMRRTGHKSVKTLERYLRSASAFAVDPLARAL